MGKVLKVGTVAFLTETTEKSARRFQLSQILLLLLRCLLILLIAVFLSRPEWVNDGSQKKSAGWILIETGQHKRANVLYQPLIDSLLKSGFTLHRWDTTFSAIDNNNREAVNGNSVETAILTPWDLIKVMDVKLPAGFEVYLFSRNSMERFNGKRPESKMVFHWFSFTPDDSVNSSIRYAHLVGKDSISVSVSRSKPSATMIETSLLQLGGQLKDSIQFSVAGNGTVVSLPGTSPVKVDTGIHRFTVVKGKSRQEANELIAALSAIKQTGRFNFVIQQKEDNDTINGSPDWVFWLSEKPVPESVKPAHLFQYVNGKEKKISSGFHHADQRYEPTQPLRLFKRIAYRDSIDAVEEVLWMDSFGEPLLTFTTGKFNHYLFYSRFNQAWTDITWNAVFPEWIFNLVNSGTAYTNMDFLDKRKLDSSQIVPEFSASLNKNYAAILKKSDLSGICWWIILLLFFTERWVSTKKKGMVKNG